MEAREEERERRRTLPKDLPGQNGSEPHMFECVGEEEEEKREIVSRIQGLNAQMRHLVVDPTETALKIASRKSFDRGFNLEDPLLPPPKKATPTVTPTNHRWWLGLYLKFQYLKI